MPVFVDCTGDTWEIDPDKIEEKITKKTKAILGVHLYGQPFEYNKVKTIADRHGLYVVEDCAQAHGALYEGKMAGRAWVLQFLSGQEFICFWGRRERYLL